MMLDVIAVVFIVVLSFILCMKDGNYNCQISHIVMGLSVMVFYKLAKYSRNRSKAKIIGQIAFGHFFSISSFQVNIPLNKL